MLDMVSWHSTFLLSGSEVYFWAGLMSDLGSTINSAITTTVEPLQIFRTRTTSLSHFYHNERCVTKCLMRNRLVRCLRNTGKSIAKQKRMATSAKATAMGNLAIYPVCKAHVRSVQMKTVQGHIADTLTLVVASCDKLIAQVH